MKRTSSAKNRLKAYVIKNKFQEDPSMRLPSRLIWRFCRHFLKLILSNHLSNLLPTLISQIFSTTFQNKQTQIFFCQIIMGSPLNSNVPEGRSVHRQYVIRECQWRKRNKRKTVSNNTLLKLNMYVFQSSNFGDSDNEVKNFSCNHRNRTRTVRPGGLLTKVY